MSERQKPTDAVVLATTAAVLLVFGGCAGNSSSIDQDVTWKQADAVLSFPETTTVRELFLRLSEQDIGQEMKNFYADTPTREAEFQPLGEYIAQYHLEPADLEDGNQRGKDMRPVAVEHRLQKRIHWKVANPSLDQVTRVYCLRTQRFSKTQRIVTWDKAKEGVLADKRVQFDVFADDQGVLLGWLNVERDIDAE